MRNKKKFLLIPVAIVAFIALKAAAVMVLWNALIPGLFHGPVVDYWQSLGLIVLAKLIFGGRPGRGGGGFGRGGWGRKRWKEKFESLTPEEKEKLRERFAERGGKCF